MPNGYTTTTSAVIPAFREDPDILDRCLDSWLAEGPTEIIVVPDVEDREVIQRLQRRAQSEPSLVVFPFVHTGKRSALGVGHPPGTGRDPRARRLGHGLGAWAAPRPCRRRSPIPRSAASEPGRTSTVPDSSVWRRVADWMIDVRYLDYVRAQSRAGAVACLSGRTVAYRRSVVMPVLEHLEDEFFLGRRCVSGDDGRLTWLVLASGYKTVYQSNARAMSMFPDTGRAFLKQRLRWSRNSYRCYLTAMWKGWLWHQPFICQLSVLQVMLTPLTMGLAMTYLVGWLLHPGPVVPLIAIGWLLLGRTVRGVSHLRQRPGDIWVLPLVAVMTIVVALPVKTYAFLTMNVHGWLTRSADQIGGEAQTAASLR